MFKALILAAGKGTRLRPLTDQCPKPMVKVGGRPLLEHTINLLASHGIIDIAINLFYHPQVVMDYFRDGHDFGVNLYYSLEPKLLGTAGALKKLQGYFDDICVVICGDVLSFADITAMVRYHQSHGGPVTIGLYRVDNPHECGLVEMTGDNRIIRFVEKPAKAEVFTDLANAGIYIIDPIVINYIPEDKEFDFGKDLFPALLENNINMYGFYIPQYLVDIGSPAKYKQANKDFENKVTGIC